MAKTKISEYSTTAGNNTDINSINIAEGCAPSGINDAIRELMRQLKEFQTGGAGDSVNSGGDFSVATNKFTVASASGNTAVAGTLGVTGAATLSSTLAVTGTTTLTGALVANGNATLGDGSGDTVTVKGTPTLEVNPTLSGGTANGVLYLNGSKVATSGSALTFDGTTLSNIGSGDRAKFGTGTRNIYIAGDSGGVSLLDGAGQTGNGWYINGASSYVAGYIGSSEAMRLTSTGLGVGTSSPGAKLDVTGTFNGTQAVFGNTSGRGLLIGTALNGGVNEGSSVLNARGAGNGQFLFQTDGTTRMTLNDSGNLGLGVTPSAWQSATIRPIEINRIGNFVGGNGTAAAVYLGANARFESANWRYANNGAAGLYTVEDNTHFWRTAASGTAGDAITFTQALTLDANGSLLIGDTSAPTNGLNTAALSTKGQGTGGSRRSTASAMGVTSSLATLATANTYSFGGYGGYGLFVCEGSDPNAAWRAAAIIWSTGAALTILNLGSSNIVVGSSGTDVTVQNTSASSQAISWSMLVLG